MDPLIIAEKIAGSTAALFNKDLTLGGEELRRGHPRTIMVDDVGVRLYRNEEDAVDVRRLTLEWGDGEIELLPSKGLSVGRYRHGGWTPFWEPVRPALESPESQDLLGHLLINGEEVGAARWIANFVGCVELLGLSNWGMPVADPETGATLPLHGEASQIPVSSLQIFVSDHCIVANGGFELNDSWWKEPASQTPWYARGAASWKVTRTLVIDRTSPRLEIVEELTNLAECARVPDWGYHYQFRASPGARLLIPSRAVTGRFEEDVEQDFDRWEPAPPSGERVERGYIHRGLSLESSPLDTPVVRGEALYPKGQNTEFIMPAAACTLSWFSCGGKDTLEFARPEVPTETLIPVAWDGMGPEIGVTDMDNHSNADPEIVHPPVSPGESVLLYSMIREK